MVELELHFSQIVQRALESQNQDMLALHALLYKNVYARFVFLILPDWFNC